MKIVMASSEMSPFAKTGGLGVVVGSLPQALAKLGHELTVFIPLYRSLLEGTLNPPLLSNRIRMGHRSVRFTVHEISNRDQVRVIGIRKDEYFDRSFLYGPPDRDYDDNAERFVFFCKAILTTIPQLGIQPDIVHAHDWQTALLPLYLKERLVTQITPAVRTVFTTHNLAFQGVFPADEFPLTDLDPRLFDIQGLEYYGKMNLTKGAALKADMMTTVSPRYASEIQTEEFGCGLEGVLRARSHPVLGILNGINVEEWNPSTDSVLTENFDALNLNPRKKCRKTLLQSLELNEGEGFPPVFGMVTRLTQQKGMDLVIQIIPALMKKGVRFVVLGDGSEEYRSALKSAETHFPQQIRIRFGFDETLARRIFAGSDFFLMPSLFEPCGLSHLQALRYGSLPIVRATGGLDDTVIPWQTKSSRGFGFKFRDPTADALLETIESALELYKKPKSFEKAQIRAMKYDCSWEKSAKLYEKMYRRLCHH